MRSLFLAVCILYATIKALSGPLLPVRVGFFFLSTGESAAMSHHCLSVASQHHKYKVTCCLVARWPQARCPNTEADGYVSRRTTAGTRWWLQKCTLRNMFFKRGCDPAADEENNDQYSSFFFSISRIICCHTWSCVSDQSSSLLIDWENPWFDQLNVRFDKKV